MTGQADGRDRATPGLRWGSATDIGNVRERNEDAPIVAAEIGLFGVTDGMGGHPGGDRAAQSVAHDLPEIMGREFVTMKARRPRALRRWLKRCVADESSQLCFQGAGQAGFEGMGATVAFVVLLNGRVYAVNLGDSRVYRVRNGAMVQLSRDHSVIAELLEQGKIGPEEVHDHAARGLLTQYVGMPEEAKPYVCSRALKPGDRFLLCTDGLTDMLEERAIRETLQANGDVQQAAETLVQAANDEGGMDNTTVVIVDWLG